MPDMPNRSKELKGRMYTTGHELKDIIDVAKQKGIVLTKQEISNAMAGRFYYSKIELALSTTIEIIEQWEKENKECEERTEEDDD